MALSMTEQVQAGFYSTAFRQDYCQARESYTQERKRAEELGTV